MITIQEVKQKSSDYQVGEEIIEKDYVISWVLWGIATHSILKDNMVFKGGTSLKKCFLETYRFSEDLDFTILSDEIYRSEKILECIREICARITQTSNIQFDNTNLRIDETENLRGEPTFQVRIYYIGPRQQIRSPARIKLDLTKYEVIILPLEKRNLIHNYSDKDDIKCEILTYSLEEILSEKTRALLERTRARDFYDVAFILRTYSTNINFNMFRKSFDGKCKYKAVNFNKIEDFITPDKEAEFRSDWQISLPHQLSYLPDFEAVKDEFLILISKILPLLVTTKITSYVEMLPTIRPRGYISIPQKFYVGGYRNPIEKLEQAGRNRVMVRMIYKNKVRFIEPYSLRVTKEGNLTFFGWQQGDHHIKQFRIDKIQNIELTQQTFYPKYPVEF